MDAIEKLKQKLTDFQAKSAVKEEIKALVTIVLGVLTKAKEEFTSLSVENLATIKQGIAYLEDFYSKQTDILDGKINTAKEQFSKDLTLLKSLITKVENIKATPGKDGIDGIDGIDGKNGKDGKNGSPDTPKEVVDKLNTLEEAIDQKVIKGLTKQITDISSNIAHGIAGSSTTLINGKLAKNINFTGAAVSYSGDNANVTITSSGGTVGPGTTNEIAYFDSANTVASLATATYPSLTELSYVKGATSAIQTQLDSKQANDAQLTSLAALAYAGNGGKFIRVNAGETDFELATVAGSGDMVLASVQTVTGLKTFNAGKFALRNVADTFSGFFTNTNTADRIYTLKDAAGTLAFTSDITGTNSGTNTGDQTITLTGGVTGSGTGSFAATVVTNANLTGVVTSVGNATAIADAALTIAKTSGLQTALDLKAPLASPTFTGTVTIPLTPSNTTDAASKGYVDSVAQGLSVKGSVLLATATALPANTYLAGVITITATGTLTVDGTVTALNDRILVKDEGAALENGIYKVTTAGAIGVAAVLTRSTDMDVAAEFPGAFVFVESGTVNTAAGFVCTNSTPPTVGTTAINFTQFSGAGEITAGAGLTKTGNTLDVVGTANRILVNADSIDISASYVGQSSITTLGTIATGVWNGTAIIGTYGGTGVNNGTKTLTYLKNISLTAADDTGVYTLPTGTKTLLATDGAGTALTGIPYTLTGTANQITLSAGTGNITLSLPNDLRLTSASVGINADSVPTLSSTSTLTNKTLTTPVVNGTITGTGQATAATASTIMMRDSNANTSVNNLVEGFTTTATAGGTTTLTITATFTQVWTGTLAQTVKLPTTSVLQGQAYYFLNESTGAVTVQSSGANTIVILAAGTSGYFTALVATPTTAANWDFQYAGAVVASGKKLNVSNSITLAGTDGTTMTFPTTSATIARTDAANTFTGVQSMTSPDTTTSITTSTTSFTAWAGATTLLTIGGTGASASLFAPSTLDTSSSVTGAIRTSGGISAAKSANIGTTLTVGTGYQIGGAAASNKILKGNGTNFVASTETYAAPGTSGNVMTSDGTNWTSTALPFDPKMRISTIFETSTRFSTTLVSGTATFGNSGLQLDTTTTTTRSASVVGFANSQANFSAFGGSPRFSANVTIDVLGTTGSSFFGMGAVTVGGTGHTYTTNHIGFKITMAASVASLFATQGDGSTENASSALTTLTATDSVDIIAVVNGTTSVDYYWRKNGGTLSAATNLTSNLPTAATLNWLQASVSNNSTATRQQIYVGAASYER